jgi:hypothetical protein
MPVWQKYFVLFSMLICSLTGTAYLLGHEFLIARKILGTHSVLAWHGIAAVIATMALGSVLPFHLKAGFQSKRKLWSGLSQLAFLATVIVSGTLLYYGSADIRDTVIAAHWILGLTFFTIFGVHVLYAKKVATPNGAKAY